MAISTIGNNGLALTSPLPVLQGGTGVTTSTGTGNNVLSISPVLVTPNIGAATVTSITGMSTPLSIAQGGTGFVDGTPMFRNRIINGGMGIWQRGASFTVAGGTVAYTADRFGSYTNNTNMTVSRNTSVPTTAGSLFSYSLQLQRPASSTQTNGLYLTQVIESINCYDMAGQTVNVSFWAKAGANFSASSNSINVSVVTGTVADQSTISMLSGTWTGGTASPYIPTITTSWTKYTFTATILSNTLEMGLQIYFTPTGTAGADDSLYITGVQLEKGSVATSFDYRPYGTELSLCQRYYEKSYDIGTVPGSATFFGSEAIAGGSRGATRFKTTKRTSPTLVSYNPLSGASGAYYQSGTSITNSPVWVDIGECGACINVSSVSTWNDVRWQWTSSAEL